MGSGGFGIVFKAKNLLEEKVYAVKVIRLEMENIHQVRDEILKEIRLLSMFDHSNIIKYNTCWFEEGINEEL